MSQPGETPAPRGGGAGQGEGELIWFTLPSFPPSTNRLHDTNYMIRTGAVRLNDHAALWKTRTIPYVAPCRWPRDWMLKLTLVYESPTWLTKAGKLRRVDVQNLEKLVIDTLFSKWDTDDSRLVEVVSRKAWGRQEQVQVVLERALVKLGRAGGVG
jgi:hypothetical protein